MPRLNCLNNSQKRLKKDIAFVDEYRLGGYQETNEELTLFARNTSRQTGIIFDTTYTGKALLGMTKHIERHSISGQSLFLHTGGLFNFIVQ